MRITFNLTAKIEVPDADYFPPVREVERQLAEYLADEGLMAINLDITNYVNLDEETKEMTSDGI